MRHPNTKRCKCHERRGEETKFSALYIPSPARTAIIINSRPLMCFFIAFLCAWLRLAEPLSATNSLTFVPAHFINGYTNSNSLFAINSHRSYICIVIRHKIYIMTTQTHTTIIKKEKKCISDAHYDDEDPLGLERIQNIRPIILPQSFKTVICQLYQFHFLLRQLIGTKSNFESICFNRNVT